MARARTSALLMIGVLGCGGFQPPADPGPDPDVLVPRLFDPTPLYQEMGFLARAEPVPFVASVHFLAGPAPDTLFAIVGVSLTSGALSFRRGGRYFEARYDAEVTFARAGRLVDQADASEVVRVATFPETLRADESVIFQRIARVPPGSLDVRVTIRDVYGDRVSRVQRTVGAPRLRDGTLAPPVPVYRATARRSRDDVPQLLVNPRATAAFGMDSLTFYLEAYGTPRHARLSATGVDGEAFWERDLAFDSPAHGLESAIVGLAPEELRVGRVTVRLIATQRDTAEAAALVSFSNQWTITDFDDILSLLRYFGRTDALAAMHDAPPEERARLWRAFWQETDPNPVTPQNEALEQYFRRVQDANTRFTEAGEPGWMTDRGEVFITLGEPDEVLDQRTSFEGTRRVIRWGYVRERLTLDFVDDTGFGRFRLTPLSRSEFDRAAARRRRAEDGF